MNPGASTITPNEIFLDDGDKFSCPEMGRSWGSGEGAQENQKMNGQNTAVKGITYVEIKSETYLQLCKGKR